MVHPRRSFDVHLEDRVSSRMGRAHPWPPRRATRAALVLLCLIFLAAAGGAQAPDVEWRRSDYFPTHPLTGPQTRETSGEDWWYDHANSYLDPTDPLSPLEGFVTVGYSSFLEVEPSERASGGCMDLTLNAHQCEHFEAPGRRRSYSQSALSLIDANDPVGSPLWYEIYNVGELFRVIQTSDGGFLAAGHTFNTRNTGARAGEPLAYNPGRTPGELEDTFDDGVSCSLDEPSRRNVRHLVLVKVDRNGNQEWQHLYGIVPYRGASGGPELAYGAPGKGFDLLETPSGNFIVVGDAVDRSRLDRCESTLQRGFLLEVTPEGHWVRSKLLGPPDVSSSLRGIARHGSGPDLRYVVAGWKLVGENQSCQLLRKAFVVQLTPDLDVEWETSGFNAGSPSGAHQSVEDVAVTRPPSGAPGEVLLPVIVDCQGCLFAGFNSGTAKVYRLDPADGTVVGVSDLGEVTAFDLKLRVTPTVDGGFAAVSSKLPPYDPSPPNDGCSYDTRFWGTDAYVAKLNASGVLEWETSFDANDKPPAPYPGDQKEQECLYSITEQPDGGFVISGNNSYNYDDSYLAKLGPPPPSEPGPDLSVQDTPRDVGLEPNPDNGPMWVSEDVWVRRDADGGFTHENPLGGSANTVYVRVTNRGDVPADGELKVYWAKASTGLQWPTHWIGYQEAGITFGDRIPVTVPIVGLAPGATTVVAVPWTVPDPAAFPQGTDRSHFCLLARIETSPGPDAGMTFPEGSDVNRNTRNNNNIAWKNVTVVEGPMKKEFVLVRNVADVAADVRLTFNPRPVDGSARDTFLDHGTVDVELGPDLFARWTEAGALGEGIRGIGGGRIRILRPNATIEGIPLDPGEAAPIAVELDLERRPADPVRFDLDVVQFSTVGGQETLVGGQRFSMPVEEPTTVDLGIHASDGLTTATAGQGIQYTITVTHGGPAPALGAAVLHPLPPGLTGATWTCVASGASTCGGAGAGDLHDTIDLHPGDTITYTLSATVSPSFFGRLVSTSEVVEPSGVLETDRTDNRSTDETLVLPPTGLAASKEVSGLGTPGSPVAYTILVLNGGATDQTDNPGHELVDVLPPELQLTGATATSGVAAADPGTGTVTWNGGVAAGGVVTVTVQALVDPASSVGQAVSNQGTLSFDSDGNGTNDASAPTDDPRLPGSADPTTFLVASLIEVPTLSTLALALLALVLLAAGLWRLGLGAGA